MLAIWSLLAMAYRDIEVQLVQVPIPHYMGTSEPACVARVNEVA